MAVDIIYKTADKGEITDAMLEAIARKALTQTKSSSDYLPIYIAELRQAAEDARKPETIERIEVEMRGYYGTLNITIDKVDILFSQNDNVVYVPHVDLIPLGEAFIKMGQQVMGE